MPDNIPPLSQSAGHEPSLGELVGQMSEQTSRLIRDEFRLAQAEMTAKGKKAGVGAALFGGSGLIALYGVACLVAAAILALAGPSRTGSRLDRRRRSARRRRRRRGDR